MRIDEDPPQSRGRSSRVWVSVPAMVGAALLVLLSYQVVSPASTLPFGLGGEASAQTECRGAAGPVPCTPTPPRVAPSECQGDQGCLTRVAQLERPCGLAGALPCTATATAIPSATAASTVAPILGASPSATGTAIRALTPTAASTREALSTQVATIVPPALAPDIPSANQQLRQVVNAEMLAAARRAGVTVNPSTMVYRSQGGVVLVNALIAGAENLTNRDLEAGADVMFAGLPYVWHPQEDPLCDYFPCDWGFYTVNVTSAPGGVGAVARLRNEAGQVVAEVPATLGRAGDHSGEDDQAPAMWFQVLGFWCNFDDDGDNVIIECVLNPFGIDLPDVEVDRIAVRVDRITAPVRPSDHVILAADRQLRQTVSAALLASGRRGGVNVDPARLVYLSRDDVVVATAGIVGAENLGPQDLAAGADVMLTYLAFPGRGGPLEDLLCGWLVAPPCFFIANVTSGTGQENGTARYRNESGQVVAEAPVMVVLTEASSGKDEQARVSGSISDHELRIRIVISHGDIVLFLLGVLIAL